MPVYLAISASAAGASVDKGNACDIACCAPKKTGSHQGALFLAAEQKIILQQANDELRKLYGKSRNMCQK